MCEAKPKQNIINLMGEEFKKPKLKAKKHQVKMVQQAFNSNHKKGGK